jgi:hypothetical protein
MAVAKVAAFARTAVTIAPDKCAHTDVPGLPPACSDPSHALDRVPGKHPSEWAVALREALHYQAYPPYVPDGLVAEWLRRGLQILAPRFDSGRGLHHLTLRRSWREVPCAEMSGSMSILYLAPCVDI